MFLLEESIAGAAHHEGMALQTIGTASQIHQFHPDAHEGPRAGLGGRQAIAGKGVGARAFLLEDQPLAGSRRLVAIFAKDGDGGVTNPLHALVMDCDRRKAGGGGLAQMASGAEQSAHQ